MNEELVMDCALCGKEAKEDEEYEWLVVNISNEDEWDNEKWFCPKCEWKLLASISLSDRKVDLIHVMKNSHLVNAMNLSGEFRMRGTKKPDYKKWLKEGK